MGEAQQRFFEHLRKFLKKIDATAQLTRLTEALQQILASDADIREIAWTEPR
jgi:hypothetical protein